MGSTTSSTSCTRNARSCTGTWARAWRRASSPRLAKTWRRWRKTTRRWASKPRRARARKRVMATSSEQAPAEEMHDGGAHLDRKFQFASCELNVEQECVFHTETVCVFTVDQRPACFLRRMSVCFPRRPTVVHSHNNTD